MENSQQSSPNKNLKQHIKWTINNKMYVLIVIATLFSLLMGAPIAYIEDLVIKSGLLHIFGSSLSTLVQTYFTLIVNLIILLAFVRFGVKRFVVKPINQIVTGIEGLLGNRIDLSHRIELNTNDETKILANYFNQFLDEVQSLVKAVDVSTDQVLHSSNLLNDSAQNTGGSSEQISQTMFQMTEGVSEQNNQIMIVVEMMKNTQDEVRVGNKKIKETVAFAVKTTSSASEANAAINKAISQLDTFTETVHFATEAIQKLGQRSDEIGEIIDVISQISEETNILALNATIEAARAGEHGNGFSVVATEIQNLAYQAKESSHKITNLIKDIQTETRVTVRSMESNLETVQNQVQIVKEGGAAVDIITGEVRKTEESIIELENILSSITNNASKVMESVEDVSAIIEESSASSEEIAATTEEQTSLAKHMIKLTEEQNQLSTELNKKIRRFII